VRDESDLFLILTIVRSKSGDVYVNFLRDDPSTWKPHTSYHASGQHHHKSFNKKLLLVYEQKPDTNFKGTINVVQTGIASDEPRAINIPCIPSEFHEIVEISLSDLKSEKYRTHLSVNLTEVGGAPIITPGAKIFRQAIFKDRMPQILVTLFETT
jgi:hypothetical protein